tara:strand:- start:108 stop:212 length:105 start_codon:yes stop_codon:yes gene_type:complete
MTYSILSRTYAYCIGALAGIALWALAELIVAVAS